MTHLFKNLFIQIHYLASYPPSLLNRDDAGFAKRILMGSHMRTRVSSQCIKSHWRQFEGQHSLLELELSKTIRSRLTFQKYIAEPLVQKGYPEDKVLNITQAIMDQVLGKSQKKHNIEKNGQNTQEQASESSDDQVVEVKGKKNKSKPQPKKDNRLETSQVTVLGRPEVDYLYALAETLLNSSIKENELDIEVKKYLQKEGVDNLRAMAMPYGLSAALHGRMITGDILSRVDAAIHVAHAITVHKEQVESDYFSVIDEIVAEDGDQGSGHINSSELTSGLFYGYVNVDVALLVSNLTGVNPKEWRQEDCSLAQEIIKRLVHIVATVSPGAKKGSTAPYTHANCVIVEVGSAQPRQLVNAFLKPVSGKNNMLQEAYTALASHINDYDGMYGTASFKRRMAAMGPVGVFQETKIIDKTDPNKSLLTIHQLADWAANQIGGK